MVNLRLFMIIFLISAGCADSDGQRRSQVAGARFNQELQGTKAPQVLHCRGGGVSPEVADGSGPASVNWSFKTAPSGTKKAELTPGTCGWFLNGVQDPLTGRLEHYISDLKESGSGSASRLQSPSAPWVGVADDEKSYFKLNGSVAGGKFLVDECLAVEKITDAPPSSQVLLGWDEPIQSVKFGIPANPKIDGKSLRQVISGSVPGRDDGQLCTACHNKDNPAGGYGGPVQANQTIQELAPGLVIDGRRWEGSEGWAVRFVGNTTKPLNVKAAMQAWIDNNFRQ